MPRIDGDALEIETPSGPARAYVHPAQSARAALILGHGAGGGVGAPDLLVAAKAALDADVSVALVEQPYRVAGKKSSPRPAQLDPAWTAVVAALREGCFAGLGAIVGGRSAGARVACRTAAQVAAQAVLCLAFPVQPPARKGAREPAPSRLDELRAPGLPTLVVQGERDRFGMPPRDEAWELVCVGGDHSLRRDHDRIAAAIEDWLGRIV